MLDKTKIKIPCRHETGEITDNSVVDDYHPLSWTEIAELLITAAKSKIEGDYRTVSVIQVRLVQGIVGMTCPRPGPNGYGEREVIGQKMQELETLYMEKYTRGGTPEVVDKLYSIMTD